MLTPQRCIRESFECCSVVQVRLVYNEHLDSDGAVIFAHACKFGMEGTVSKRSDFAYRSGRVKSWLKIKNPKSPAALRIEDGTF